jgi:hypothetical protein
MDNESEGMPEASLASSSQRQLKGCIPKRERSSGLLKCTEQLMGPHVDEGPGFTLNGDPVHSAILRLTTNGYAERGNPGAPLLKEWAAKLYGAPGEDAPRSNRHGESPWIG